MADKDRVFEVVVLAAWTSDCRELVAIIAVNVVAISV